MSEAIDSDLAVEVEGKDRSGPDSARDGEPSAQLSALADVVSNGIALTFRGRLVWASDRLVEMTGRRDAAALRDVPLWST